MKKTLFFLWLGVTYLKAQATYELPQQYRITREFKDPYLTLPAPSVSTKPASPSFRVPSLQTDLPKSVIKLINLHQDLSLKQKEQDGYRIQILSTTDPEQVKKARMEFIELNNPLKVYQVYERPYYKLRVGDFQTRFEAEQVVYTLLKTFPAAFVVNDKVKINP